MKTAATGALLVLTFALGAGAKPNPEPEDAPVLAGESVAIENQGPATVVFDLSIQGGTWNPYSLPAKTRATYDKAKLIRVCTVGYPCKEYALQQGERYALVVSAKRWDVNHLSAPDR